MSYCLPVKFDGLHLYPYFKGNEKHAKWKYRYCFLLFSGDITFLVYK